MISHNYLWIMEDGGCEHRLCNHTDLNSNPVFTVYYLHNFGQDINSICRPVFSPINHI